jgi:hypothetical protein
LLKDAGEFRVSEVYELPGGGFDLTGLPAELDSKHLDHPGECQQAFVDVAALSEANTIRLSLGNSL